MSALKTPCDVAELIRSHPSIDEGFCQQTEGFEKRKSHPIPGGGGAWTYTYRRTSSWRVVIHVKRKGDPDWTTTGVQQSYEGQGDSLAGALRDALRRAGLKENE